MSETTATASPDDVTREIIANAPGAAAATSKRSLQMRQFKTKNNIAYCVKNQVIVPLGQIVGHVYDMVIKTGSLPDGTPKDSVFALGDFQATVYETGEILEANGAYLPGYYAEALKAALTRGAASNLGIVFGIEIVAEPTGLDEKTGLPRSIPFAYGVRNLIARQPDSPLEMVKRQMAKAGALRLPPPAPLEARAPVMLPSRAGEAPTAVPADMASLDDGEPVYQDAEPQGAMGGAATVGDAEAAKPAHGRGKRAAAE